MTRQGPPRNLSASVMQRLLNRAKENGEDPQYVLTRYGLERLLYRLSRSPHAKNFTVKGAMMFLVWRGVPYRLTKDLDLLAAQGGNEQELKEIFQGICRVAVEDDGLVFTERSVRVAPIREEDAYGGMRVTLESRLGKARIPLQVDIGFGDVVTPKALNVDFPVLLDFPAPHVAVYPRETAIAEKFETMVRLGIVNSRMRDYYDIWVMSREFEFDGEVLQAAIRATFKRRKTALPTDAPFGLTAEFATDDTKQAQWRAFSTKNKLKVEDANLESLLETVRSFVMPPATAVRQTDAFAETWPKGGPWQEKSDREAKSN